jgi:UDP-N-acetylmuramoyl-tripeptide--D-alanyl-D-alanine ligase
MKLEELYRIYLEHPRVTTDSRKIGEGSIFFALKGENFNGNSFARNALDMGASYAVIDDENYVTDERTILVDNVLHMLQDLARLHRQKSGIPILAITGSNGKTTTKELVASVLSRKFKIVFTEGNLNNHIGVPLTLLRLTPDTQIGIVEMGANHPDEIDELCKIALPDFGLITNVGRAHLEGFGSFEGVIRTKTELYRFLQHNNGTIFINRANPFLSKLAGHERNVSYTTEKGGEGLEGEAISSEPFLVFKVLFPKGWLYIKTGLFGRYNLENAMAAAAVGLYFGIDPTEIASAIEAYHPDNNRSQMVNTERNSLLMDAYNANPSSTTAALENFAQLDVPVKGVILGDMLELGTVSHEEHQRIVDLLIAMKLDVVFLVGPLFSGCHLPDTFQRFNDSNELATFLKDKQPTGYHFLIKGSRGMKLESIVPSL